MLRVKMVDILIRYFAGDLTLIDEIKANSLSNAPLNMLARDSLANQPVLGDGLGRKRKLDDET